MAGIGVRLNKIYGKNTLTTDLVGVGYSTVVTIAPMLVVIGAIVAMEYFLGFSRIGYRERELFSSTILYIFIFSLLTAAPFNSVLSRYMSDVIYNETYEDILPCYYLGLLMNVVFSALPGIPFCIHEHFVGGVNVIYVFTGYCGYMALVFVFYSMLYLSICKDYKKISFFFMITLFCQSNRVAGDLQYAAVDHNRFLDDRSTGIFCCQKLFQGQQRKVQRGVGIFQKILAACNN